MARKFCEYCSTYSDAALNKCPNCSAPLAHESIPDQDNLKEVITAAVSSGLRSAGGVVNNITNQNERQPSSHTYGEKRMCYKAITLLLLFLCGFMGGHKFYEGKPAFGILYIFTFGGFIIGVIIDFFAILTRPHIYPAKHF